MTDHTDANHGDYEGDKEHPIFGNRKRPTRHDQMKMIMDEVTAMNERREWLADKYIGPAQDEAITDPTDKQIWGIAAITAIEEEWIMDPELREELSIINYEDDDE